MSPYGATSTPWVAFSRVTPWVRRSRKVLVVLAVLGYNVGEIRIVEVLGWNVGEIRIVGKIKDWIGKYLPLRFAEPVTKTEKKVYKAKGEPRLLYVKRNKAISLGKGASKEEEKVSSDENEMVEVKVLMALAEENDVIIKEGARNDEWVKISMRKHISHKRETTTASSIAITDLQRTDYDSVDESSGINPSVLVDQTKSARDWLKTAHTDSGTNEESRADEISKKIKLEDLSDLLKDTRSAFFTPDSLQDEPIIVSDESEEEEAKKDDTHATFHDNKLEQQKVKAEAEVASLKARPSYLDINQLTDLLATSLKPEFSKLLASHDFSSYLPNTLKELPSKFTELSRKIKELKKHVQDMEIELSRDLKETPTKLETFTISSLSS
ncbi:hypothetical protein Tco_0546649 [Tanacetum coccineum]